MLLEKQSLAIVHFCSSRSFFLGRADCGLKPFEPEIEEAVLKILRRKQVWDCFKESPVKIGSRGFQTKGFWESKNEKNKTCLKRQREYKPIQPKVVLKKRRKIQQKQILTQLPVNSNMMYMPQVDPVVFYQYQMYTQQIALQQLAMQQQMYMRNFVQSQNL